MNEGTQIRQEVDIYLHGAEADKMWGIAQAQIAFTSKRADTDKLLRPRQIGLAKSDKVPPDHYKFINRSDASLVSNW